MFLTGKANFIANRQVQSKVNSNIYYFAKFVDEKGSELELQCEAPINIPRFALVKFVADVVQGKYPRYQLITHEEVK